MANHSYDARYLLCPLPVLRAQKILKKMDVGDTLTMIGTSEGGIDEFKLFCKTACHHFISGRMNGEVWNIEIQK